MLDMSGTQPKPAQRSDLVPANTSPDRPTLRLQDDLNDAAPAGDGQPVQPIGPNQESAFTSGGVTYKTSLPGAGGVGWGSGEPIRDGSQPTAPAALAPKPTRGSDAWRRRNRLPRSSFKVPEKPERKETPDAQSGSADSSGTDRRHPRSTRSHAERTVRARAGTGTGHRSRQGRGSCPQTEGQGRTVRPRRRRWRATVPNAAANGPAGQGEATKEDADAATRRQEERTRNRSAISDYRKATLDDSTETTRKRKRSRNLRCGPRRQRSARTRRTSRA